MPVTNLTDNSDIEVSSSINFVSGKPAWLSVNSPPRTKVRSGEVSKLSFEVVIGNIPVDSQPPEIKIKLQAVRVNGNEE